MEIHIVKEGETIYTIAEKYNVSADRLILDNDIDTEKKLVIGQAIVILYPNETYTVKDGDTIEEIAMQFKIPVMQLYRNNSFLSNKNNLKAGETLVISYHNDKGDINTFGFAFPYIDKMLLSKTLPFLTYLCISGNQISNNAEITTINDEEIINISKKLGVSPIMLISSLINIELNYIDSSYNILNNEKLLEKLIHNIINVIKNKGYMGLCITIEYLSSFNLALYQNYLKKLSFYLKRENIKLFITISQDSLNISQDAFKLIDPNIETYLDGIIFMNYNKNINIFSPPMPVTSIKHLEDFLHICLDLVDEKKINIGCPVLGLDWELPYVTNISSLTIIKHDTAIDIASESNSIIFFDENSSTPYFMYEVKKSNNIIKHIIWFVDARTINSLISLIPIYGLNGTGLWNVMYYFAQLWSIINSQFKITKLLPEP